MKEFILRLLLGLGFQNKVLKENLADRALFDLSNCFARGVWGGLPYSDTHADVTYVCKQ